MARSNRIRTNITRISDSHPSAEPDLYLSSIDPFAGEVPYPTSSVPDRPREHYWSNIGQEGPRSLLEPLPAPDLGKRPSQRYKRSGGPLERAIRLLGVENPKAVAFCVRRKERRAVLFKLGKAGRNKRKSPGRGSRGRKYQRSYYSQWRC